MAECVQPFKLPDKKGGHIVPCGKCPNCMARRASGWSFRLMQQYKIADTAHFITLTYDTQNVPITQRGFMDLRKRDFQLFIKRLRKAQHRYNRGKNGMPIKYYGVGEYGGKTMRPHYHAIMFNAEMELIQPAWQLGSVHYGQVTEASVGYTLKYISKGRVIPLHKNDDRQKEFSLMSKGLGMNYITMAMMRWHMADLENRMYCTLNDGKKVAMPRYYKNKLYYQEERDRIRFVNQPKLIQEMYDRIQEIGYEEYCKEKELIKQAVYAKAEYQKKSTIKSKI